MAYQTGTLSRVLEDVDSRVLAMKRRCQQWVSQMAAGSVGSPVILNVYVVLRSERAVLSSAKTTPGIGSYAQEQKSDGTLDVSVEFDALLLAIDNVTSWIATNFPKDANGYLLAYTLGVDEPTHRQFDSTQTEGLQTVLQALISQIN